LAWDRLSQAVGANSHLRLLQADHIYVSLTSQTKMSSNGGQGGQGGPHTNQSSAANSDAARQASFVIRHLQNEKSVDYFAAGVCGIMAILMIAHGVRYIYHKGTQSSGKSVLRTMAYPFVAVTR
jgi:hypothetical protein